MIIGQTTPTHFSDDELGKKILILYLGKYSKYSMCGQVRARVCVCVVGVTWGFCDSPPGQMMYFF